MTEKKKIDTTFVDLGGNKYTELRVMGLRFHRVKDQRPEIPWRLEGEERVYPGFRVMKASAMVGCLV